MAATSTMFCRICNDHTSIFCGRQWLSCQKKQRTQLSGLLSAFPSSGFTSRISRNIAKYYKSFVGRNFKALAQMALFVLSPFLAPAEIEVWLALSKVFKFAYCDTVNPESMGYYETIVQNFVATTVVHGIFLLYGGSPKSTFLNICECLVRHLVITPKGLWISM
eukprot:Em0004g1083a